MRKLVLIRRIVYLKVQISYQYLHRQGIGLLLRNEYNRKIVKPTQFKVLT